MSISPRQCVAVFVLTAAASTRAAAHEGWGIVRDARGTIYITDIPANSIWKILPGGRAEAVLRGVHSHALVLGNDGSVYGTDVAISSPVRSIWRIDTSGRQHTVTPRATGLPVDLQAFLIASDGTAYSTTPFEFSLAPELRSLYVVRRSSAGVIDTIAGGRYGFADGVGRAAMFTGIDGMAWLPDSSLLVVDGNRLRRVSRQGEVRTIARNLTERRWDQDIMGVSVAGDSTYYVADFASRRILRVQGSTISAAATSGWYWSPTGVFATPDGIYTLEHPRAPVGILGDLGVGPYIRVRLIRANGSAQTLATIFGRHTMFAALLLGAMVIAVAVIRRLTSRGA